MMNGQHRGQTVPLSVYQALRDKYAWVYNLLSNPNLTPGQKLSMWALHQELPKQQYKARDDGLVPIYLPNLGARVGMSPESVGSNLKKLAEAGNDVLKRVVTAKNDKGKGVIQTNYYQLSLHAQLEPQTLKMKSGEENNHGGKRVRCTSCGGDNIRKRTIIICNDCGAVLDDSVTAVNPPDPFEDVADLDTEELPVPLKKTVLKVVPRKENP